MAVKPKRNQKVMTDEEKSIIAKNQEIRIENELKDKEVIKRAEVEIFKRDKENLPTILKERLELIEQELESVAEIKGLKASRIYQLIARQTYYTSNITIGYSPKELFVIFDVYKDVVSKINNYTLFVPSKKNFCAFAGITTATFNKYLQSNDEEKRNVAMMIDDYVTEMNIDASKMRKIDNQTTIFDMKATHGMIEANAPVIITHTTQTNLDDVMSRIEAIKQGRVINAEFKEKD
jgi:hypothetical protein